MNLILLLISTIIRQKNTKGCMAFIEIGGRETNGGCLVQSVDRVVVAAVWLFVNSLE